MESGLPAEALRPSTSCNEQRKRLTSSAWSKTVSKYIILKRFHVHV